MYAARRIAAQTLSARDITAQDLGSALGRAVAAMQARSARATAAIVHSGARKMVQDPWRIVRVLGGEDLGAGGPADVPTDLPAAIARCEELLAASEAHAAAGHWTFDLNRHLALRQARIALWRLRIGELVEAAQAGRGRADAPRTGPASIPAGEAA